MTFPKTKCGISVSVSCSAGISFIATNANRLYANNKTIQAPNIALGICFTGFFASSIKSHAISNAIKGQSATRTKVNKEVLG